MTLTAPLLLTASAAHADIPVTKAGWWTRSPSPPVVPDGGLAAGESPDGVLTESAFDLNTGGGASGAKLKILEFDGQGQQTASLQVCTTSDGWAEVKGGDLALAPRPNCPDPAVLLARDSNGAWTADLNPLVAGKSGHVSIMVVPGPDSAALPGGARTGAFQVSFQPPTVEGTAAPAEQSSSSDEVAASPAFGTTPATTYSPAFGGELSTPEVAPQLSAAPANELVSAPPLGSSNSNVNFPVRVSSTPQKRGKSRLVIIGWFFLAAVIGAIAGLWRWARTEGTIDRFIPLRTGGSILTPPTE